MDVRVAINQLIAGQPIVNVTCWNNFTESAVEGQEFANLVRASYVTYVQGEFSSLWSLQGISVTYFPASGPYTISYGFTSGPLAGGGNSEILAGQTSLVMSLQHVGSRPNRGRLYISGLTEQQVSGGLFSASVRTAFVNLLSAWRDGLTTSGNEMFLRIGRRNADGPGYEVTSPVTNIVGRAAPGVQRSRRAGNL